MKILFMKKNKKKAFTVFLILQVVTAFNLYASTNQSKLRDCSSLLTNSLSEHSKQIKKRSFKSLDDLLLAFTEGFSPDLMDQEQRAAFEIYRKMRFGNPDTSLNAGTLDEIAKEISQYPNLEKDRIYFRNYKLEVSERSYPVTTELEQFISSQVKSAGQVRANLYQIEANLGFWKKLLQYQEPERFAENAKDKNEQKALKKAAMEHFTGYINNFLTSNERSFIGNTKEPIKERAKLLYTKLLKAREALQTNGLDVRPINQSIVDLIHTLGYFDPAISKSLKSNDGLERLGAYRKVLEERDSFSMELGYEDHFKQVLRTFSVTMPSGMTSKDGLIDHILDLEAKVIAGSTRVGDSTQKKTVRHLSLPESPFRSCLGGSDCSSRTYLTKALDPNYNYFTLTDSEGYSSGHITVVLGEAKKNGKPIKVAFIDKVQNVDSLDLPLMIEGVRQSVLEHGYLLALPKDVGDHNGLSNEETTRSFVERNIGVNEEISLSGFTPHKHSYNFPNTYSRAEDGLLTYPVRELKFNQDVSLNKGLVNEPWQASGFKLEDLVQSSIDLKNGNLNDRLRYVPSMNAIEAAGLKGDPKFDETLKLWLSDPNQDVKLKKQVLIFEWTEQNTSLPDLLTNFSSQVQVNLIQNLLDTPRYKERIIKNKKQIPELLVLVRGNKNLREALINAYDPKLTELIVKVLESGEFTNDRAQTIITQIKESFGAVEIDAMVNVLKLVEGSELKADFEMALIRAYIQLINSDAALERDLSASLTSDHPVIQRFGRKILEWSEKVNESHFPTLKVYRDLMSFHESARGRVTLAESSLLWMGETEVKAELKADFLMAQIGQGEKVFDRYLKAVPSSQINDFWKRVNARSSLKTFLEIAESKGVRDFLLEEAVFESFLYESQFLPKPGSPKTFIMGEAESQVEMTLERSFEMGATQVTQLQYALVMDENPSHFVVDKKNLVLEDKWNSKTVVVDANRPVEKVSWEDTQKFIERLNELNPEFKYDLPTETQWEYAARGGTETTYSFGEDLNELSRHAWYSDSSQGQTQPVARLRANPFGFYDVHGNVWDWVRDAYGNLPHSPKTDYEGPDSGSNRVIRGGSWDTSAPHNLRSAIRSPAGPGDSSNGVGFRLLRTPK